MTKRIAIAKSIEHAANLNIINNGRVNMLDHHSISIDKMTTTEINKQINLQKMHNARTKRATNNLGNNEKLMARYGDMYTQAEINLLHDPHPYFTAAGVTSINPGTLTDDETLELLDQLGMYARCIDENNYLMI